MGKKIAIVGATGAVGQELLKVLEQRRFPVELLRLLASSRSAGKPMRFAGESHVVEELTPDSFAGIDVAFFSAGGSISREFAPHAAKAGAVVVDNTSAFRMKEGIPLVVPEVNPEQIHKHAGLIANPNCSTIIMAVALWPLHKHVRVKRVICSTYQAVSGAGAAALAELEEQIRQHARGGSIRHSVLPWPVLNNVFSHNSPVMPNGYNEEENKMINETGKIFGASAPRVSATCVRVPVDRTHCESLNLQFERPVSEDEARQVLAAAPGIKVVDDRDANHFPMPIEAGGQDDVLVGRIRTDASRDDGLGIELFVAGDQIRKGAATNAVQIAERL